MPDPTELPDPRETLYDVLIVGAGIAGLSAAIYTTRERMATLVLERTMPGGQILTTARVENYPGFPEPINGMELADRLTQQATRFGARILNNSEVTALAPVGEGGDRVIEARAGDAVYRGRTAILAVGSEYKKLNAPGEKRLTGYGVSYCGTCDAPFYEGKHVVVVGGGNTAVDEGLHLLKFVRQLTFITRGSGLRAEAVLLEELDQHGDKVEVRPRATVDEILGEKHVEAVCIHNIETGKRDRFECDGVFVFIGLQPLTGFLKGTLALSDAGFVKTDSCRLETSVPGIWAAGDVRGGAMKQAATAAGDGVIAALMAKQALRVMGPP